MLGHEFPQLAVQRTGMQELPKLLVAALADIPHVSVLSVIWSA